MRANRSRSTAWRSRCRPTRRGSRTATAPSRGPASSCLSELRTSASPCYQRSSSPASPRCDTYYALAILTILTQTWLYLLRSTHCTPLFTPRPPPGRDLVVVGVHARGLRPGDGLPETAAQAAAARSDVLRSDVSPTRRPGSGGAGYGGRLRLEAPSSLHACTGPQAWLQGSCRAVAGQCRGRMGATVPRRSRPEAPPTPPALTSVCFRLGRVARVSSLLRQLKGEGEVSVPFDPKLWSKEGCHNRRYMLPGIACSVSRRAAPHRAAACVPACLLSRLPACLPAYLLTAYLRCIQPQGALLRLTMDSTYYASTCYASTCYASNLLCLYLLCL